MKLCKIEGCNREHYGKGLCNIHYYIENKAKILERNTKYYANNKVRLSKQKAEYRAKNRAKILDYKAEWRDKNKVEILKKQSEYRDKNKVRLSKQKAEYRAKNKDRLAEQKSKYYIENKELFSWYQAEYRAKNKDAIRVRQAKYRAKNRAKISQHMTIYRRERRHIDPLFKTTISLRRRISLALQAQFTSKYHHFHELLGCTPAECNKHLESKFQIARPNAPRPDCDTVMTWDNYGKDWQIDHIKPCSSFDLTIPEQQRLCFNYSNLQPLWTEDNQAKGNKLVTCGVSIIEVSDGSPR